MHPNFQPEPVSFTSRTMLRGVIVGPDGYFRTVFCPVAKSLTFVPPTSITRTLGDFAVRAAFMAAPPVDHFLQCEVSADALGILEGTGGAEKQINKLNCGG